MNIPEIRTWIGGEPERSDEELPVRSDLHDPNTGERLAGNRAASDAQVERAMASAAHAHESGEWFGLGPDGRAEVLERFAGELDAIAEDVATLDAVNSGVPISVTTLFAQSAGDTVRGAARRAIDAGDERAVPADRRNVVLRRVPWGPTALIAPWNAPGAMATKKLAYALAAGAPVILKPSSASPWSAQLILEAAERAGFPRGLVSLVPGGGRLGAALVADPRIRAISMTGSTPTGRAIAASAAPNFTRLRLELGSSNPAIVLADADLDVTANQLAKGFLKLSGQWCEAPRRVFVERSVLADTVGALENALGQETLGSSLDRSTTVGPVAFEDRRRELFEQRDALVAAGANLVEIGDAPEQGWFIAPTLIVGERLDAKEELFGPLLTVQPFDDIDDAVDRANDAQVGLAGYVFSADEERGAAIGRRLIAGEVKINGTSVLDMSAESAQSFFGDSGIGGHGDDDLLDFFTGRQIVGVDAPNLPV